MGYITKYPNSREFKNYMYRALSINGVFKARILHNSTIKQNIQSSYVTKSNTWKLPHEHPHPSWL